MSVVISCGAGVEVEVDRASQTFTLRLRDVPSRAEFSANVHSFRIPLSLLDTIDRAIREVRKELALDTNV